MLTNLNSQKYKLVNPALWLIKSIDQRRQTIYKVGKSIIKLQKCFLDNGLSYCEKITDVFELLYNYQISSIIDLLFSSGLNEYELVNFYRTGYLPGRISESILNNLPLNDAFNSYHSVMVGASGALYGVLVGFAMLFPNAQLMLLV